MLPILSYDCLVAQLIIPTKKRQHCLEIDCVLIKNKKVMMLLCECNFNTQLKIFKEKKIHFVEVFLRDLFEKPSNFNERVK